MASTRLAEAVGYPGSSVAFAQLLSGMERDGLIVREVRGKRTYRIALSAPVAVRTPVQAPVQAPMQAPMQATARAEAPAAFSASIDYDELARRIIVQLVRRLSELSAAELATLERLLLPGQEVVAGATATATG